MPDALTWTELAVLMVDVPEPEPTISGAIRSVDGDDASRRFHTSSWAEGQPTPVQAREAAAAHGESPYQVWRDGFKVRIEWPDGSPSLIVDDERFWRFPRPNEGGDVVVSPITSLRYGGHGTELLWHQDGSRLLGRGSRQPLGPVETTSFLGRPAWSVRVGPPPGKSFSSLWVVDAETGLLLRDYNELLGSVDEWVELVVGETLDLELFTWNGPAVAEAQVHADSMDEHEKLMASRRDWFTANVAPLPLRFDVVVSVDVHSWDDETGAFHATLGSGQGSLARRPHSDEPWPESGSGQIHHWTDGPWDWVYHSWELELSPEGLEALKRQLRT
ncbi:hypothetical protein acdb102_06870 [Acidothermaceae bacterium B102]|nr:hypothetical protein acdb102_06870 [Acidothermaceae bacterium B102]